MRKHHRTEEQLIKETTLCKKQIYLMGNMKQISEIKDEQLQWEKG